MRLIDADEIGLTDFEIVMCNGDYKEALKMLLNKISNQPTAYSVDKVIKELEKLEDNSNDHMYESYFDGKEDGIREATEIVKQGGASDDVCEWRLCDEEANVYDTSCRNPHILIEGTPKENNYEYCPYCGRKILTK